MSLRYILFILAYAIASHSLVGGSYQENQINVRTLQDQCLICPRDDMPMIPEVEPLPNIPGHTCGMVQEEEASKITRQEQKIDNGPHSMRILQGNV